MEPIANRDRWSEFPRNINADDPSYDERNKQTHTCTSQSLERLGLFLVVKSGSGDFFQEL